MTYTQQFVVVCFTIIVISLISINITNESYAWHQNFIDDVTASELYLNNPNDPMIKQWQDAMMDKAVGVEGCVNPNPVSYKILAMEACENAEVDCRSTLKLYYSKETGDKVSDILNKDSHERIDNLYKEMYNQDFDTWFREHVDKTCTSKISAIVDNCNSHPNSLLICEDMRIFQYNANAIFAEVNEDDNNVSEPQNNIEPEFTYDINKAYDSFKNNQTK